MLEHGCKVSEVMTTEPVTITEDTSLEAIVALMEKNKLKRLPVLRDGQVVGIVSRANLLQAVASLAREVPDPTADDDHIRDRIINALGKNDWCPQGLNVIVRNGIVHLGGIITDERAKGRHRLRGEHLRREEDSRSSVLGRPDVRAVHDRAERTRTGKGELNRPAPVEIIRRYSLRSTRRAPGRSGGALACAPVSPCRNSWCG